MKSESGSGDAPSAERRASQEPRGRRASELGESKQHSVSLSSTVSTVHERVGATWPASSSPEPCARCSRSPTSLDAGHLAQERVWTCSRHSQLAVHDRARPCATSHGSSTRRAPPNLFLVLVTSPFCNRVLDLAHRLKRESRFSFVLCNHAPASPGVRLAR